MQVSLRAATIDPVESPTIAGLRVETSRIFDLG